MKHNYALFAAGIVLGIGGASLQGTTGWLIGLAGVMLFISGFYLPQGK